MGMKGWATIQGSKYDQQMGGTDSRCRCCGRLWLHRLHQSPQTTCFGLSLSVFGYWLCQLPMVWSGEICLNCLYISFLTCKMKDCCVGCSNIAKSPEYCQLSINVKYSLHLKVFRARPSEEMGGELVPGWVWIRLDWGGAEIRDQGLGEGKGGRDAHDPHSHPMRVAGVTCRSCSERRLWREKERLEAAIGRENKDERTWERQERALAVSCGVGKFKEKLEKFLSHWVKGNEIQASNKTKQNPPTNWYWNESED